MSRQGQGHKRRTERDVELLSCVCIRQADGKWNADPRANAMGMLSTLLIFIFEHPHKAPTEKKRHASE